MYYISIVFLSFLVGVSTSGSFDDSMMRVDTQFALIILFMLSLVALFVKETDG